MTYVDVVLGDAPVGYWRLDETAGPRAADSSGNANHGTYAGSPTYNQSGIVTTNPSVAFADDGNTLVSVPNASIPYSDGFTVECWLYLTGWGTTATWRVVFLHGDEGARHFGLWLLNGFNGPLYYDVGGQAQQSAQSLVLNRWYHLCLVHPPAAQGLLYINGALDSFLATSSSPPAGTTAPLTIGGHGRGFNGVTGRVDDVSYYNYNLSTARVRAHCAAGLSYPDTLLTQNPVGYWRLGEPSGTACLDSSGNANHGTYGPAPVLGQPGFLPTSKDTCASFTPAAASQASIPHTASLNCTTAWTIECWVYLRSYPGAALAPMFFSDAFPGAENTVQMCLGVQNTDKLMVGTYSAVNGWTQAMSTATLPLNQWMHVAGVYSGPGGTLTAYLNGVSIALLSTGVPTFVPSVTSNKWIGRRWDGDEHPDALIDEVLLYNTALPANVIQVHQAAGRPYYASVLEDAPLAYWRLSEGPGSTVVADASGNGRHGTYAGGITFGQPGLVGTQPDTSLLLDGTSGYASVPQLGLTMNAGIGPGTMEAWVRLDAGYSGNPRIMAFGANIAWEMFVSGGSRNLCVFLFNGGVLDTGIPLALGVTYHLAVSVGTQGAGNIAVYINGVQRLNVANVGSTNSNSGLALQIGQSGNNADYWKGLISNVSIYPSALSAARILAHYEAGRVAPLQRWDGSQWAPLDARRWDGSQWVYLNPRRWDGSVWR